MSKKNLYKLVVINILLVVLAFSSNTKAAKFNMSYLYGNYDYSELVARTGNSLNEVSPSYFDLYSSGNLKLNKVDTAFVKEMHSKGIKVVPFLSNHWDKDKGIAALNNIENLTSQIADAIKKYDLDGINVDLENLSEKYRDSYVQLVKKLREKLGPDKSISVAVAANPNNWQTGWHGSYDYANLAKYADYLMIMAYDEHYESGTEGPVASIDFVEKSILYALERVDSSKIVLGIPFFGRYWQNGVYYGGYGISLNRIETLTNKYQTYFTYDEETESAKAVMTIKSHEAKLTVNGRTLSAGTYTIWYENERSISAKLDLVKKYNLKGTGSWSLGQETPETWNYYDEKLNEKSEQISPETDNVQDILNPATWAEESIEYVKTKGWMIGKTNTEFYPKDKLTRAEFATIIVRILNLERYSAQTYKYTDTSGHWAEKYISLVTAAGYMEGYEDGSFKPQKYITREEVAKVLSNMNINNSENNIENISFNDINERDWSYHYIIKIAQKGIIKGYENGSFKPRQEITREEIAVILSRAF